MLNVRNTYWVALLVAVMVTWGSEAAAGTAVHGYSIPTAEGPRNPSIQVCTPTNMGLAGHGSTNALQYYGVDSRSFTASVCLPLPSETGPRSFSVPVDVVEAIEVIEHILVGHFEHDSANFGDVEALPALDVIVSWLAATPSAGIKLQGHTDSTGSAEYNLQLSQRRVEAVKALFVEKGVDTARIHAEWYGENSLLLSLLGRQQDNRRVDIEVYQIIEGEPLDAFVPPVPVDAVVEVEEIQ